MTIQDVIRYFLPSLNGVEPFFPIYHIYFNLLKGDIWACVIMSEIIRLQGSEGGKENGGWVVWTFETIQKKYYISRHIFNKSAEALIPFGLEKELRPHRLYPEAITGVWHYRINVDVLVNATHNYLNEQNTPPDDIAYPPSNNFTTPPENSSRIEDLSLRKVSKRDMHPTPNGVGAGLSKDSNSKKKATPNIPPNQSDETPAPRPAHDSPHKSAVHNGSHSRTPTPYEIVYREVRRKFFAIADDLPADDKVTGQIKKIAGYLWNESIRPANESLEDKGTGLIRDVEHFVKWYNRKFDGALLPRSPEKLGTHWLAYLSTRPSHTPTASYVMESWGGAKTDDTNSPANGGGGDTMMTVDSNIFGFLFGNRKDNGNE